MLCMLVFLLPYVFAPNTLLLPDAVGATRSTFQISDDLFVDHSRKDCLTIDDGQLYEALDQVALVGHSNCGQLKLGLFADCLVVNWLVLHGILSLICHCLADTQE